MGGAPIVDERWTAGGDTPPVTRAPARPSRHRARPPVAPDEVGLAVGVVWVGTLAEQEARDLGHHRLGTEHLLLALLRLGDAAGRRLTSHGASFAEVRRTIERDGAPGEMDNANGRPGWSTAASAAVRSARVAAGADGRSEVSGRDLLVAMLTPGSRAAAVLAELGVDAEAVLAPAVPVAETTAAPSTAPTHAAPEPATPEPAATEPSEPEEPVAPVVPEQATPPRAAARVA